MAPTNKARAAGVSASSFFDLKAEIAKKEDEFARNKATGGSKYTVGGVKRPDKVSESRSRHGRIEYKYNAETDCMGSLQ
jgi:hypothetical protein